MTPEEETKITRYREALGAEGTPDMPKDEFNAKFLAALEDPLIQARMSMYAREYIFGGGNTISPPFERPPATLLDIEFLRDTASCPCGKVTVTFDPMAARGLNAHEVRKLWPRGQCQDCKAIVYASSAHYIEGDW